VAVLFAVFHSPPPDTEALFVTDTAEVNGTFATS
jgi:hypothetical protein